MFTVFLLIYLGDSSSSATLSGIIETSGDWMTLLDDVVLAMDEWEEKRGNEREDRTDIDRRLAAVAKGGRTRALGENLRNDERYQ